MSCYPTKHKGFCSQSLNKFYEVYFSLFVVVVVVALSKPEALQERRSLKKVPKGTSDYQAAWITNSDDEEEAGEDENEDDDEFDEEIAEGSDSDQSMVMHLLACATKLTLT